MDKTTFRHGRKEKRESEGQIWAVNLQITRAYHQVRYASSMFLRDGSLTSVMQNNDSQRDACEFLICLAIGRQDLLPFSRQGSVAPLHHHATNEIGLVQMDWRYHLAVLNKAQSDCENMISRVELVRLFMLLVAGQDKAIANCRPGIAPHRFIGLVTSRLSPV